MEQKIYFKEEGVQVQSPADEDGWAKILLQETSNLPIGDFPTDGLKAYWKFNEGTGTIVNDSIGTNHGTTTDVWDSHGMNGNCKYINSETTAINIPHSPSITFAGNHSISIWVKPDNPTPRPEQVIFTKGNNPSNYLLDYYVGGFFWRNGKADSQSDYTLFTPTNYPAGVWYHIVLIYDTILGKKIYINGENVANDTQGGNVYTTDEDLVFGSLWGGTFTYSGLIDEFCLWDRAITPEEVAEIYNNGAGKFL